MKQMLSITFFVCVLQPGSYYMQFESATWRVWCILEWVKVVVSKLNLALITCIMLMPLGANRLRAVVIDTVQAHSKTGVIQGMVWIKIDKTEKG